MNLCDDLYLGPEIKLNVNINYKDDSTPNMQPKVFVPIRLTYRNARNDDIYPDV
jgi:hypothetical protein